MSCEERLSFWCTKRLVIRTLAHLLKCLVCSCPEFRQRYCIFIFFKRNLNKKLIANFLAWLTRWEFAHINIFSLEKFYRAPVNREDIWPQITVSLNAGPAPAAKVAVSHSIASSFCRETCLCQPWVNHRSQKVAY